MPVGRPFVYVILSAALFGASAPAAKVLVGDIRPVALAGLLYLGAFLGLGLYVVVSRLRGDGVDKGAPLRRRDAPYLAGAIFAGGIAAPILLMTGISVVTGFASSLLLNLEGVATAIIAWAAFQEYVSKRVWFSLAFMTAAGVLLALGPGGGGSSLWGALLIVLAMVCWGVDNNLTRQISERDPRQIAMLKGLVAGTASISLAFILGQLPLFGADVLAALLLGALSYGASLVLFIMALEGLGSARTGAFFSLGPFVGALISLLFLNEGVYLSMLPAAALMAVGAYLLVSERHAHEHSHEREVHSHEHRTDEHHQHIHPSGTEEPHTHEHVHDAQVHSHVHWPDPEHRHRH